MTDSQAVVVANWRLGRHVHYFQWSEGGGYEVYDIWDDFIIYSIPQYGGHGTFEAIVHSFGELDNWLDANVLS